MFTPRWCLQTESTLVNVFAEETFPALANFRQIFVVSHFQNCKPKYLSQKKDSRSPLRGQKHTTQPLSPPAWQAPSSSAALQTKNPSEGYWGQLTKSQLAYKTTKTWRRGRTKFIKQSTHGNYLLSHLVKWERAHETWPDTAPLRLRWNGVYSLLFLWQKKSSSTPSECVFAGYMPSEGGSAGWWPLDLSKIGKYYVGGKSFIATEMPLCLHKPERKKAA